MALANLRVNQVLGPFPIGVDLLDDGQPISEATPETSRPIISMLGIQAPSGTMIEINKNKIRIGKTGIYQIDDGITEVKSLKILSPTDEDSQIDFAY